jgi:hypothetical protein
LSVRRTAAAALATAGLAAGGCGGDDEAPPAPLPSGGATEAAPPATEPEPPPTDTAPARTEREPEAAERPGEEARSARRRRESPEDQPGGAGDEIPARSQALFTGRGGRIRPRTIRVPPFIAVRVELRSADGRLYSLRGQGRRLRAGGQLASMAATFDGLRPGRRLRLRGPGGGVTVEASAEPGP